MLGAFAPLCPCDFYLMAEDKKSFILYSDLLTVVKKLVLKDRQDKTNYAGELFLHILEYVNDNNPVPIDFIVEMAFEPIRQQLKRDLKNWEAEVIKKSQGGAMGNLKRWDPDIYQEVIDQKLSIHDGIQKAKQRKKNVSHTDPTASLPIASVAVNGTVTVNDINTSTSTNVDVVGLADWNAVKKDISSVTVFIRKHKPKFAEPYVELWNMFSEKYGTSKVLSVSETRRRKLRTRLSDKKFDFPEILKNAADQKFALESKWFSFDFLIENDTNYIKVLEKKYIQSHKIEKPEEAGLSATLGGGYGDERH